MEACCGHELPMRQEGRTWPLRAAPPGAQLAGGAARSQGRYTHLVVFHPLPAELSVGRGHGLYHEGSRHKAVGKGRSLTAKGRREVGGGTMTKEEPFQDQQAQHILSSESCSLGDFQDASDLMKCVRIRDALRACLHVLVYV